MKKNRIHTAGLSLSRIKTTALSPTLISPLLVLFCMAAVFLIYNLFPLGSLTLVWCDMRQQVVPLLLDFKDTLAGKSGFFLSMANAGGMNFWGVFLFFLSSPFTFLAAFVSKPDMLYFANVLVVLKMMTCAVTASFFFKRYFPGLGRVQISILSAMYACCGYTMLFYQNIVWLDAMYLFPLLLIGLGELIDQNKPLFYTLILAAFIVVNFYLSYMAVIFIILAFGVYVYFCVPQGQRGRSIALLGAASVIAALLTGVVWLPALLQYLQSARNESLIKSLADGELFTALYTTLPLLLCTVLSFAVLPLFFSYDLFKQRKHFTVLLLAVMMTLPVFIEPINKMWHTGSYQAFPVRYGYITVFMGLIIAAAVLSRLNAQQPPRKGGFAGFLLALSALLISASCAYQMLTKHLDDLRAYTSSLWGDNVSFRYLFISFIILFAAYLLLLWLYKSGNVGRRVFTALFCALFFVEAFFNGAVYIGSAANPATNYQSAISLSGHIQDTGFYRVKTEKKYFDVNLVGAMGYNSLSHYTSLTSQDYMFAMKKLGYSSYWMEVSSSGGTEFTDALLSNRYTIKSAADITEGDHSVYSNSNYDIVKNSYYLPLGVVMSGNMSTAKLKTLADLPGLSRMNLQQYLFKTIFHSDQQLITEYPYGSLTNVQAAKDGKITRINLGEASSILYSIHVKDRQTLYLDCFDRLSNSLVEPVNDSLTVTVNDVLINLDYPSQQGNGLLNLGSYQDETVTVKIGVLKNITAKSFGIYGLSTDTLSAALQTARTAQLTITGDSIRGTAQTRTDGDSLLLMLPYDKGYSVTVNGHAAGIARVFDSFMAVKLDKGSNTISIRFLPQGFILGFTLTLSGLALLIALLIYFRRRFAHLLKIIEKPATALYIIVFIVTLIMIYVFPLLIYIESNLLGTSAIL